MTSSRQRPPPLVQPAGAPLDRVLTVPNALSLLRLLAIAPFCWLVLGPHDDGWALVVLALSSITDWADGKIARRFGSTSRLGQLLDPFADRGYIAAAAVCLAVRGIVPWWVLGSLAGRDLLLAGCLPLLRRHGYGPLPVHFLGKAATFSLLYAFPVLLIAQLGRHWALVARPVGWAFVIWGVALYWWAGALYLVQVAQLVRADRGAGHRPAAGNNAPVTEGGRHR